MKALTPIPADYGTPIPNGGTVVRVDYASSTYDEQPEALAKYAYVYLPYGYDASKKYNILYCLHGGGGEIEVYFGSEDKPAPVKLTLDHMIANGDIEPIIAVSPTYYNDKRTFQGMRGRQGAANIVENFQYELIRDLIPAVEGRFSTWAETTDPEGIRASRSHRAYTGYSMGSLSTWMTLIHCVDSFRYFMPMSGDCWVDGVGGPGHTADGAAAAAEKLEEAVKGREFFVYAVTGDKDAAFAPMTALMEALKQHAPSFRFVSEDNPAGNISFFAEPEATHDYFYMPLYFYNGLPHFWKA